MLVELEPLAVPPGPAALALLPRLQRALAGDAPIVPYAAGTPAPALPSPLVPPEWPPDLAVAIGTSGTTGRPKRALLSAGALAASAAATHATLGLDDGGPPAQWLLAMPAHHVAGLQVLLRSIAEGTEPVVLDTSRGFTTRDFAAATRRLDAAYRSVTALVPTQLVRLLDDPVTHDLLPRFHAVLVGGAAVPHTLRRRAAAAGVRLVASYGMSETAGGCVYDGRPLPGCTVECDTDGRVLLAGPVLAHGYLGRPDLTSESFGADTDGVRWYRTDDLGHLEDGRLHIHGRLDDLITTGGLKVGPRLVEDAIHTHVPDVRDVVVLGVPDPVWGECVAAALVLHPSALHRSPRVGDIRAALRGAIPDHALPHRVVVLDALPLVGPGKPDRRALRTLLAVGE